MRKNFGNLKTIIYLCILKGIVNQNQFHCGVRKQRQENGERLQQTYQGREKKNLFF